MSGASGESVVYSPLEAARSEDFAGFWCNTDGWTTLEGAARYTAEEVASGRFALPGGDACWLTVDEANQLVAEFASSSPAP